MDKAAIDKKVRAMVNWLKQSRRHGVKKGEVRKMLLIFNSVAHFLTDAVCAAAVSASSGLGRGSFPRS